ncbi:MAG: hypothetical protein GTO14_24000 [Anaerolineales bacterium]|nr:hypothetical protein [Anaerolineales bacterium]
MNRRERRSKVLLEHGAGLDAAAELLSYNANPYQRGQLKRMPHFPLESEMHVAAWDRYSKAVQESGIFDVLRTRLPQLAFPIREGISQTPGYVAATRRGMSVDLIPEATGLPLKRSKDLRLVIHQSLAGEIPILVTAHRQDFEALVQAFTRRNEPETIPASMGACIVSGFINWDRIRELRRLWEEEGFSDRSEAGWMEEFRLRIMPHKELYQDRFIVLSDGPYSNVPAKKMGFKDGQWRDLSVNLRLEHECTHYLTRRLFSSMRNNLLDELLADYHAIVAAAGRYRADWALLFLGLENFPDYREGGRFENYCGDPPLSEEATLVLQKLVRDAVENLEHFDYTHAEELVTKDAQGQLILVLARLTLEELACEEIDAHVQRARSEGSSQEEKQS